MATATRPATSGPLSTTSGLSNVVPASLDAASFTAISSFAPVYQATTACLPCAATEGPLTGHAGIFQPSACTGFGVDQALPSKRVA